MKSMSVAATRPTPAQPAPTTLAVSEIFQSIQGEGPNVGAPAAFLRLGFCNLRCVWCDTKYTWDWDEYDPKNEVELVPLAEVHRRLQAHACQHLVVTGGEPLLQQRALAPLLAPLREEGYFIEVETSGTIRPSSALLGIVHEWNVSPKLENSGNPRERREVEEALRTLVATEQSFFKFVVCDPTDLDEVNAWVGRYGMREDQVYLMPEATDPETLARRTPWVTDLCRKHGYRFSTRLQIELWGGGRGV